MKDEFIKNILNKDKGEPVEPMNQWSRLLRRVDESEPRLLNSSFLKPAFGIICCSLFIYMSFSHNYFKDVDIKENQKSLAQFIVEDDYISDSQELYTWADL